MVVQYRVMPTIEPILIVLNHLTLISTASSRPGFFVRALCRRTRWSRLSIILSQTQPAAPFGCRRAASDRVMSVWHAPQESRTRERAPHLPRERCRSTVSRRPPQSRMAVFALDGEAIAGGHAGERVARRRGDLVSDQRPAGRGRDDAARHVARHDLRRRHISELVAVRGVAVCPPYRPSDWQRSKQ